MKYGGLKKKCILRLAKAKLKMEKKMTLPILLTPPCCSASNQHKAQLTTTKRMEEISKERYAFSFPRVNFSFKTLYFILRWNYCPFLKKKLSNIKVKISCTRNKLDQF